MSLTKLLLLEYNQTLRKGLIDKFTKENPRLTDASINAYLDRFKELKHRFPSDKRDITKLSWKEVEGLVDSFVSTKAKLGEVKITSDQNLVYDKDGIRVFKGSDKESCIKYSTGYTFCIGSKDKDRNMYDNYRSRHGGGTPYFVINQNLPTSHNYHLSVVYKFGAKDDYFNVTDATNDYGNEQEFDSKQEFKEFYEEEFEVDLNNEFVEVFKADPLDVAKEVIKAIDKGDHYLSKGGVHLKGLKLTTIKLFDKPWIVEGDFNCADNQLTSLEGAPQKVGGSFDCDGNRLISLKGVPQKVGGDFYCHDNQLTSLEGAPQEVGGNFSCSSNQLSSLKGAPRRVEDGFYCYNNQLTSLEGAPQIVGRDFYCYNNQLISLKGAPQVVGAYFDCVNNKLTSLEGAPQKIDGNFNCSSNQLTSLKGAPQEVSGNFSCASNQLTSLEGAPKEVGVHFICQNNQLTSLKGAPQKVGGDFGCSSNPKLSQEEISTYLRKIGKQ